MSNTEKKASITDQIDFQIEIDEQRALTIHIPTKIEVLQRVWILFRLFFVSYNIACIWALDAR